MHIAVLECCAVLGRVDVRRVRFRVFERCAFLVGVVVRRVRIGGVLFDVVGLVMRCVGFVVTSSM